MSKCVRGLLAAKDAVRAAGGSAVLKQHGWRCDVYGQLQTGLNVAIRSWQSVPCVVVIHVVVDDGIGVNGGKAWRARPLRERAGHIVSTTLSNAAELSRMVVGTTFS